MQQPTSKKIFHILFVNSIQMFGGGEVWMLTAMQALRQRGHRLGIICQPKTELEHRSSALGFPTFPLPFRGDFDPNTILHVFKIIRKFKADIVLTNMDKELRVVGAATRFCKHTALIPRRGIDHPLKNHLIYRLTYQKWADGVIANSMATKYSILKNAPWLPQEKIKIIYNGIDPAKFKRKSDRIRKKYGLGKDDFVFGFAGQLDKRKGLHDLLPAFVRVHNKIPNARLLLAGEGSMRSEIEHFVTGNLLRDSVFLLGFTNDIPEFMANIDALVLPSLWEGFGIVLIEAMAAQKPVIATRISNLPEVVKDGEGGLLVPVNNPGELVQAMLKIGSQPQLAQIMGMSGRKRVEENFTLNRMIDEIEDYFHTVRRQMAEGR